MDIYTIQTKHCTKCNTTKSISEFPKNKTRKSGYGSQCKECNRLRVKTYYNNNKEKKHEYTLQYYHKNKEKLNAKIKTKRETDPLFKLRTSIRSHIGLKLRKNNYTKKSRTYEILGCSYDDFKRHIESQFLEGMTWDNHGEWHLDHIVPVSYGLNEAEVLALNHYTNFQPLWAIDNWSNGNRYIG